MGGKGGFAGRGENWPTPQVGTGENSHGQISGDFRNRMEELLTAPMWMTPNVPNGGRTMPAELVASKGMTVGGQNRTVDLGSQVTHWATPKANDSEKRGNVAHRPHMPELVGQAQAWPTPKGTDGTKGGPNQAGSKGDLMLPSAAAQWPTPMTVNTTSNRAKYGRETSGPSRGGARFGLEDIANTWPTPAARDSKGANSEQHALVTGGGRKHMDQLSNFVAHSSHLAQPTPDGPPSCGSGPASPQPSTKRLNPAFGEWLMGWPIGHTIAEPSASSASEMASWRCKLRQRLSYLFAE
jgi:hypothetical protein